MRRQESEIKETKKTHLGFQFGQVRVLIKITLLIEVEYHGFSFKYFFWKISNTDSKATRKSIESQYSE